MDGLIKVNRRNPDSLSIPFEVHTQLHKQITNVLCSEAQIPVHSKAGFTVESGFPREIRKPFVIAVGVKARLQAINFMLRF